MRIRHVTPLCVMLCTGVFAACAQESSPCSPFALAVANISVPPWSAVLPADSFVLAVTNISIASVQVGTNNVVGFHFADPAVVNVDELDQELAKSGIHSKRLIRIMEGPNVVAEGRLLGRSWGIRANGFLLKFDTPERAQNAAAIMQEKGTLVFPKPHDSKSWTIF